MKTLKEVINETTALAEKILAEAPGLISLTFEFKDFPLDEMEAYAKEHNEEVKFLPYLSRFGFLASSPRSSVYIHIRSIEVKARLVYDEVEMSEVKI